MLRSGFAIAGLTAGALAIALVACSSSDSSTTGGGGVVDQTGTVPPPAGPMHAGDGPGVVLAISHLYLGDTDRSIGGAAPVPNTSDGWKQFGFNLDGKISTKASSDLCKPSSGASPSAVYPDGKNGIDNSFGSQILPILLGFSPDASDKINQTITMGKFTIMLDLEKLGSSAEYNPLLTKLYGGGDLMGTPKFDGTDMWPVVYELLNNGDVTNPKVQFPKSYTVATAGAPTGTSTWVSGTKAPLALSLSIAGYSLTLQINSALIAMDMSPDHKAASNGTIAGIISTEDFIAELQKVAGSFDMGLCKGSTFNSIAAELRQASDIMADGSQDPSKTCDGISIGLGFDALPVQLGAATMPNNNPPKDPCAAAGGGSTTATTTTTGAGGGNGSGGAGGA